MSLHGIPAVFTYESEEFDLIAAQQKTERTRDLDWLASVYSKPVVIIVQARKTYIFWLKAEIIEGDRIAWMITHSSWSEGAFTARITFYSTDDDVSEKYSSLVANTVLCH